MSGLIEQKIGANLECSEVQDREKRRQHEKDLQESKAPAKASMAAEVPQYSDDQRIVGEREAFMAQQAENSQRCRDKRCSSGTHMQKRSQCDEQEEIQCD